LINIPIKTNSRDELIDITRKIQQVLSSSGIKDGIVCVFCPHTTAAVTINENADPDVAFDIISTLKKNFPNLPSYRHIEGNSDSHIKSSLFGCSETIIVENGVLQLGTWQSIYFAEFDGPRQRYIWIQVVGNP
jgi:secondary thiamine-phosphate synthase enzyme